MENVTAIVKINTTSNKVSDKFKQETSTKTVYVTADKDNTKVIEDSHIYLQDLLDKSKDLDEVTVITNNDLDISIKKEKYDPDILKIVKHYENSDGINPHLVNPIYLKKTEAEEKAGL